MADEPEEGAVGYKRPPRRTRFKPGQSGNPRGRGKGTPRFTTDLRAELAEQVVIRENGSERRISKQRALVKALVAAAVRGDMRAANAIVSFSTKFFPDAADNAPATNDSSEDQDIIDAFLDREIERRRTLIKKDPATSDAKGKKTQ